MTARTYSTLDANRIGPGLAPDDSNLRVTTLIACDGKRMILGDLAQFSGVSTYEVYFWSTLRNPLTALASYGVAQPDVDLANFVGGDAAGKSWGFRPADGQVWNANANVSGTSVQAVAERVCLGLRLTLGPSLCTCEWLVNGSVVYSTSALPTGKAWVPAISMGSTVAGDVSATVNFGLNRFDQTTATTGWWQQAPGLATFYCAMATEGFLSATTDTPANQSYGPYVLNAAGVSIKTMPQAWFNRSGGGTAQASVTSLRLNNADGTFNELLGADVRDSAVVLQTLDAPARGAGTLAAARTWFTGLLDTPTQPDRTTINVGLRGTLARFDKPCPMRIVAPFYDESSAGKVWPIGLGAQRNVQPLLLDAPTRLYALGDAPMSNVSVVSDMAAPLDPYAAPPQYVPALNNAGIALETNPVGRLAVDCSSVGAQYTIPGVADVLNGDGDFEVWSGSPLRPANFAATLGVGGNLSRQGAPGNYFATLFTATAWDPSTGKTASYMNTSYGTPALLAGRSYRITVRLIQSYADSPAYAGGIAGGLMLRSDLTSRADGAISPNGIPLSRANAYDQNYTFTYTVPNGSNRQLYLITAPSQGSDFKLSKGSASATFDDLAVELLGQYVQAPLDGITLHDAFTEILVNRCEEDPSVFSASDCDAIDAAAGYTIGLRWEDQPNVLAMLTKAVDQFGGVIYEDQDGVIRVGRLTNNEDGAVVAAFSMANVDIDSFSAQPDKAQGLTTNFGARRNCTPFGASDFVTDTVTVSPGIRAQYQGISQFNLSATAPLAQEYSAARGAGRLHTWIDDKGQALTEGNRVNSLFAEKHLLRTFVAYFDGAALGVGPSIDPRLIRYNHKITLTIPEFGWVDERMTIVGWEPFPTGGKIILTVRH